MPCQGTHQGIPQHADDLVGCEGLRVNLRHVSTADVVVLLGSTQLGGQQHAAPVGECGILASQTQQVDAVVGVHSLRGRFLQ